jgi:RepB DNA-primase from phage plasmid
MDLLCASRKVEDEIVNQDRGPEGSIGHEKHGRGVEQARQMVDLFGSLGVETLDITETNVDGQKQVFRRAVRLEAVWNGMAHLLDSAIACQRNLIVRPRYGSVELVQLDDLGAVLLERLRAVAFLILATSPGNHQAWVAVPECEPEFVRRLRRGAGADLSASGATRVAGSINFKRKYAPCFPTVRLLEGTPQRTVTRAELQALELVAAPDPWAIIRPDTVRSGSHTKSWPSYERCLQNTPHAHDSDRADISRADFTFCLIAIDWGWSVHKTCQYLLQKSSKARENGAAYAWLTAQRAAMVVQRRRKSPQITC